MAASPYTVSDVMTLTAVAIGREASYKEIVELMHHWKVSAVPVLEGEGRVVGVVSEEDLLPKEEFRQDDPKLPAQLEEASKADAVLAGDLMSSPAITVHPDATLAEAARIMARKRVKRLPVVNDLGMLEGVVSRSDLLKVFLRPDEEIDEEIRSAVVAGLSPRRRWSSLCWTVSSPFGGLSGTVRWCRYWPVPFARSKASWTYAWNLPETSGASRFRGNGHQ